MTEKLYNELGKVNDPERKEYKMKLDVVINESAFGRSMEEENGYRCVILYFVEEKTAVFLADDLSKHFDLIDKLLNAHGLSGHLKNHEIRGKVIPLGGGFIKKYSDGVVGIAHQSGGLEKYYTEDYEILAKKYPFVSQKDDIWKNTMPVSLLEQMAPEILRQTGAEKIDLSFYYKLLEKGFDTNEVLKKIPQ